MIFAKFGLLFFVLKRLNLNLTVPNLTKRPEALVTGRAVCAVRGVRKPCSIVPGLPDCVPGRAKPLTGLPDCDMGLLIKHIRKWQD